MNDPLRSAPCHRRSAPSVFVIPRLMLLAALAAARLHAQQDQTVTGNLTVAGSTAVNSTAASTSSTTGALTVGGGLGVRGDLNTGGGVSATTFTASGGSLIGSASGLTLLAGGSNQNVTINPSGTGATILNGNVGIGTTTPTAELEVAGAAKVGGRLTLLRDISMPANLGYRPAALDVRTPGIGDTEAMIDFHYTDGLPMERGDYFALRINPSGTQLFVGGLLTAEQDVAVYGNANVSGNLTVGGTFWATGFSGAGLTGDTNGLTLNAGGTDQNVTITPSGTGATILNGNVGIGTTDHSAKLSIGAPVGTAVFDLRAPSEVPSRSVPTPYAAAYGISFGRGAAVLSSSPPYAPTFLDNGALVFSSRVSEVNGSAFSPGAFVFETGQVLIGTDVNNGVDTLQVNGSIGGADGLKLNAGGTNKNVTLTPSGTGATILNGNVGIGTTTPTAKLAIAFGTTTSATSNPVITFSGNDHIAGNEMTAGIGFADDSISGGVSALEFKVVDPVAGGGNEFVFRGSSLANDLRIIDGRLRFGLDAFLYRSAVNTLSTDGNLSVGGTLNVTGTLSAASLQIAGQPFNPANYIQQSGGVVTGTLSATALAATGGGITGGTTGLTLNAGGMDKNLTLVPTGAGRVTITGSATSNRQLEIVGGAGQDATIGFVSGSFQQPYSIFLKQTDGHLELRDAGGGIVLAGRGPINVNAGGTNQNVVLTPSGTGATVLNGNVGVGTAFPGGKLDVAGSLLVGDPAASNQLMLIRGSNAGTHVEARLDAAATLFLRNTNGGPNTYADIYFQDAGGNGVAGVIGVFVDDAANQGDLAFTTRAANQNVAEKMRILGNGNVGIGTTAPSAKLDVAGNAKVQGNADVTGTLNAANLQIAGQPVNLANYVQQSGSVMSGALAATALTTTTGNLTGGATGLTLSAGGNALAEFRATGPILFGQPASVTNAASGEVVMANAKRLRWANAAGTTTYRLVGLTAGNVWAFDDDGLGSVFSGTLATSNTTAATSTTTGALVNAGGFGNAGAAYIGGTLNTSSYLRTGGATLTANMAAGDILTPNNVGLRSVNAAGTDTVALIRLNGSNTVQLAPAGQSVTTAADLTVGGTLTATQFLYVDRPATSDFSYLQYRTAGAGRWSVGMRNNESSYSIFSEYLSTKVVEIPNALALNQGSVAIKWTTPSTSATTGALVVTGGAGIGGDLNVGGALSLNGQAVTPANYVLKTGGTMTGALSATSLQTGAGSITGSASNLTITSGATGANRDIVLAPSDAGDVVIPNGNKLRMKGSTTRFAEIDVGLVSATDTPLLDFGLVAKGGMLVGNVDPAANTVLLKFGTRDDQGTFTESLRFSATPAGSMITGGAGGLTLNAGGASKNISLVPSGSGSTLLYGNVGIGTATPDSPLTVNNNGVTDGAFILKVKGTAGEGGFKRRGTDLETVSNMATFSALRVGSAYAGNVPTDGKALFAGQVGIGTATPSVAQLHVVNTSGAQVARFESLNSSGTYISIDNNGQNVGLIGSGSNLLSGGVRDLALLTEGAIVLSAGTAPRLAVNANGNVGIGTTGPTAKLDVAGDTKISGNLAVGGGATVAGLTSTNALAVTTNATVGGNATVSGVMGASTLNVTANATVGGNQTVTGSVTAGGALNAASLTSSTGAVTGSSTNGLTLNAGGTDQSITLAPSGTGIVGVGSGTAGVLKIFGTTPSTSPTTGSLINAGGLGNAGKAFFGDDVTVGPVSILPASSTVRINNGRPFDLIGAAASLKWRDGTAAQDIWSYTPATGTNLFSSATASTNSTSGALVVTGGAGIGGNLNAGGALSVTANATVGGAFSVTGATTLSGPTNATTLTVTSTAAVQGASSFGNTMTFASGATTMGQIAWSDTPVTSTQFTAGAGRALLLGANGNALTGLSISTAGNVGIGTTGPAEKLEVVGNAKITGNVAVSGTTTTGSMNVTGTLSASTIVSAAGNTNLSLDSAGTGTVNIGGGDHAGGDIYLGSASNGRTTYAGNFLPHTGNAFNLGTQAAGGRWMNGYFAGTVFAASFVAEAGTLAGRSAAGSSNGLTLLATDTDDSKNIILLPTGTGNVGIGTSNPTYKLSVNGTIRAREVIVENTDWSDYVFAPDYQLAPLSEVEKHIKEHRHLPGVPSAQAVTERGVSVGEMQATLLAKIEELTLHMIEQEKRIASQAERLERLETENHALRSER